MDSATIVLNNEQEPIAAKLNRDIDLRGAAVTQGVGRRLLRDPIEVDRDIRVDRSQSVCPQ